MTIATWAPPRVIRADRVLQAEFRLSKPEFSILVQLRSAQGEPAP
jgi:hypothetical protein